MIRRLSLFAALTTALLWAGSAGAQDKFIVVDGSIRLDAKRSMPLALEYATGWEANDDNFQTALGSGIYRGFPFQFQGGSSDKKHYNFLKTITIPQVAGLKWSGMGLQDATGYAQGDAGVFFCIRGISASTTFDGSTYKLTSSGASTVATVVGRTVVAEDLYNSVYISGGTNATAGWYGITAVDTGANTWTLGGSGSPTANWCTGAVTAGTGYYCPAMFRNTAYGLTVEGIAFTGKVLSADATGAQVLWHNFPTVSGVTTELSGHQTVMRNCSFAWADVAILDGRNMAGAFANGAATEWIGRTDGHGDTHILDNMIFSHVKCCKYRRNQNGVWDYGKAWRVADLDGDILRYDCGGKCCYDTLWVSGAGSGTRQNVLYLGPGVETNMNPYIVRNVSFDHATEHPQLLVTDFTRSAGTNSAVVNFDGGLIDVNDNDPSHLDDFYLVDIDGKGFYSFRYIAGANTSDSVSGFWENSVKLEKDDQSNEPVVEFIGCMLDVTDPEDIIDEANTPAGITVKFENCYDSEFALFDGGATTTYTTQ